MKKFFTLSALVALVGICAISAPVEARSCFSFNIGALFGPPAPVYVVEQAPVYVTPQPVYVAPQPVAPVYVAPQPANAVYYVGPRPCRRTYVYPQPYVRPGVSLSWSSCR